MELHIICSMMKVFIVAALSADGFISHDTDEMADWTSKEDKKLFVELTKRAGVLVMGGATYRTIGRPLPGRKNIVYTRRPIDGDVEVTQEAPQALVRRLAQEGYDELAVCGGRSIYEMFLAAGVVDELYLTIEPVLFGSGIKLCELAVDMPLKLLDSRLLNENSMLLHYEIRHEKPGA